MSAWQETTLGEITDWMSGGTPNKGVSKYWNGDIPWISANSMNGARYNTSDLMITKDGLENGSRLAPKGAILLLVRGGALHSKIPVGVAMRDVSFNQDVKAIIAKNKVDPWFLFAWFCAQKKFLLNNVVEPTGIGAGKLDTDRLKRLSILLPSLSEQKEIAHFVKTLDDKIELNQRMNETLEAMARALFKSWFVDFDPVRAKAEGRKPEGMDAATAALFPAAFNDDGLPEGWEQTTLEKAADLNSESWGNANHPDDVEYVDLANTKWGTIESTQNFSWDDAPSRARRVLRPGDTIVGTVRPGNGSFSFIGSDGLTGSTGFAVLRPKKEIYREAVCYAATSKDNIDRLAHLADGGAYPAVRPDVVLSTPFIFPGDKILAAYSQSTAALLDRAEMNKQENKTLAVLRDALLPKLISGELRIDDAVPVRKEVAG